MTAIKLGYEVGTGKLVKIELSHIIVTGITQLSGKTTTLEALIKRSGLRAIVFKTKIGEKGFNEGTEIPPFFKDRSDYEFVKSLIEAYSKEKLFLEKGTLMRLCKGSGSLLDIKKKVDEALTGKLRAIELEIYTRLQHNLENLIPQIQYANLSKILTVYKGINIMNLERFSEEAQSLIIQSVVGEVLKNMRDTIIVIPEAWKFIPQKYNNPCKRVVESFIRQGATNNNFIWVDSMPDYECVLVKKDGKIDTITFGDLFNLEGEIKQEKRHEVKTLKENIYILDSDKSRLRWCPIKKVFRHKYNGEILSINTLDGIIDVSPNHPVMKYPRYVTNAENLKIGDRIQSRLIEKKWRIHNNKGLFVGNEDLAWLLGFYCAEGWVNGKHICFANKEKELLGIIKKTIKENFHLSASFTSSRKGVYNLDTASPKMVDYFKENCYDTSKVYDSSTKKVPTIILNAPKDIKKAFLDGYLEGDGSFDKERNYWRTIGSNSRLLLLGIMELLNAVKGRVNYSLHKREDKPNFIQLSLNKQKNIKKRDSIKKISKRFYNGYLYDIEVNSPNHTFYMGIGNIRTHNSQDMAGVDKIPLKQISTWILGYQSERNEVKHTLDQISLPKKNKPKEDEIMTLRKGHFFLSSYDGVTKVYVQPTWLNDETSLKIAKGESSVDDVEKPESLVPLSTVPQESKSDVELRFDDSGIKRELIEIRSDFFNKIEEMQTSMRKIFSEIYELKTAGNGINEDELVSKVLQKTSVNNINKEEIISEILSKIPKVTGAVTYEVAPLEKIKKDFLNEAKDNLISAINGLDEQQKKMLKWIEQTGKNTKKAEIFLNCFGKSHTSGSAYTQLAKKILEMKKIEIIRVDTQQRIYPNLKKRVSEMIEQYGASESEINQVYDHILYDLLNKGVG